MNHHRRPALSALLITSLALLSAPCAPLSAAVTGRSADSSIAGTEKLLSDSSGTDTYILVSTLFNTPAIVSPVITTGLTASGSAANDFSASTGAFKTSTGLNVFGGSTHSFAGKLFPTTDDGAALGDTTHGFSDLFLASGGVINWSNGNVVLTQSSGLLTLGTGELRISNPGTNAASVPTLGSTSTLTNKTLTAPVFSGSITGTYTLAGTPSITAPALTSPTVATKISPATDDGAPLGDATHGWSDLFLASGAVINCSNGNVTITHTSGILTMGTGEWRITTPGTNSASVPTLGSTSTLTNKTLTGPVIASGLTASGSTSNDYSGSTGTFKTSTGANTLNGAVTIADATTPSLTTAAGKTNSGFVLLNGKTSGGFKLLPTDASGFTLTLKNAAIATADRTLTLPDPGGSDSVVYLALAQTLTNKTFTAPVLGAATGTSLAVTGAVTSSGTAGIGYATGAGGTVTQASSKSTGVTLSKTCGQITLNNAALADATTVSFTVTNTTVAATDVIIVNHSSAGTVGAYTVHANSIGSGSFKISVRNVSGGSLSEAIVLSFAVIKGASS